MSGGKVGGSLDLRRQKLGATPLKTNEGPLKINGWRWLAYVFPTETVHF